MGMLAKSTGGADFKPAKPGSYTGVVVGVYILGTQPSSDPKYKPKVQALFDVELHKRSGVVKAEDGSPQRSSTIVGLSFHEKSSLVPIAGSLRGKSYSKDDLKAIGDGFDVEGLLGLAARVEVINVEKGDKTRDQIKSWLALDLEEDPIPKPVSPLVYWDWSLGKPVPKRIKGLWERSEEFKSGAYPLPNEGEEPAESEPPAETPDEAPAPVKKGKGKK